MPLASSRRNEKSRSSQKKVGIMSDTAASSASDCFTELVTRVISPSVEMAASSMCPTELYRKTDESMSASVNTRTSLSSVASSASMPSESTKSTSKPPSVG